MLLPLLALALALGLLLIWLRQVPLRGVHSDDALMLHGSPLHHCAVSVRRRWHTTAPTPLLPGWQ